PDPFSRAEAESIWARLVAGWADHLDASGARLLIDGIPNAQDTSGSYEGVTRMLWGIGGWLSAPGRPAVVTWRDRHYDVEALARRAVLAGTDPDSPGYWGHAADGRRDQRTVESGQVAWFLWVTRGRIWDRLQDPERERIVAWLERVAPPPDEPWGSNWALFWVLNHAGRSVLGSRGDRRLIEDVTGPYLDRVWCGDGWYDDGPGWGTNHFDDYVYWVFASHVLLWAQMDAGADPARVRELRGRIRMLMAHMPYSFAASGAYTEYGRSLAYTFARLGAPLLAYRAGVWPHSPGMLRRLVGRHLRWYLDRGAIRADGTLRQELTATGSSAVRESYISTGATYWAMQAFAGLWSLADDDPFWSLDEEALPVEVNDVVRILPEPGWVLVGDRKSGEVHRFSARSQHGEPAKYGKFHASTVAPITVGLLNGRPAPDAMICLTDGVAFGHRDRINAGAVGKPGWLRSRYRQRVGAWEHEIETLIVISGNLHLRAHRIRVEPGAQPVGAIEGGGALGFDPGQRPEVKADAATLTSAAGLGGRWSTIRGLVGYDEVVSPAGHSGIGAVQAEVLIPMLRASLREGWQTLVCLVSLGDDQDLTSLASLSPAVTWRDDGSVQVAGWFADDLVVPAITP
ncbi:MAG: DUF2264 domain-containing protein, partial [Thermomicrobiales bacterium]